MRNDGTSIQERHQTMESNMVRSPGTGTIAILGIVAAATCFFAGCAFASEEGVAPEKGKGKVLVAFATSKGSTSEIAEAIASEIGAAGWQAEAVNLKDSPLTDGYDHVILGGPIYYGKTKEMKAFVEKHGADLENRLARGLCRGNGFRC